jgi:hypothetical protein
MRTSTRKGLSERQEYLEFEQKLHLNPEKIEKLVAKQEEILHSD